MIRTLLITGLVTTLALISTPAAAQPRKSTPHLSEQQLRNRIALHKSDFDYLLGDWHYTAQSVEWGAFTGVWSAVRLPTGGGVNILDEYRVHDDSGRTVVSSSTLRAYNPRDDQWELVTVDERTGLRDIGTGRRVGAEMHLEQTFGATTSTPATWRIRYHDIRPDSFRWSADRSIDAGKTWQRNYITLQTRRIGPARQLGTLTRGAEPAR